MKAVAAISHACIGHALERVTICLAHGVEFSTHLPASSQNVLPRIVSTRCRGLGADLTAFAQITEAGRHVGHGVLENTAGFLLSPSGIFHEEAPCSNRVPQKK